MNLLCLLWVCFAYYDSALLSMNLLCLLWICFAYYDSASLTMNLLCLLWIFFAYYDFALLTMTLPCLLWICIAYYDSALLQTDQLTVLAHSEVVWGPVWLTKLALSEVNWEPVWIDFICCTCCHYQGNMALCGAGSNLCYVARSRRHTHWLTSWTSSYD